MPDEGEEGSTAMPDEGEEATMMEDEGEEATMMEDEGEEATMMEVDIGIIAMLSHEEEVEAETEEDDMNTEWTYDPWERQPKLLPGVVDDKYEVVEI